MNISRNLFLAALVVCAFPVIASENPVVPTVATPGMCAKAMHMCKSLGAFVFCKPLDFVAKNGGAVRFATYLATVKEGAQVGRITQFVQSYPVGTARVAALAELALICALSYKAYQSFVAEDENDDSDEYDFGVFGEDDSDLDAEEAE